MEGGAFPRASAVVSLSLCFQLPIKLEIAEQTLTVPLCVCEFVYMSSKKVMDRTCAYALHV